LRSKKRQRKRRAYAGAPRKPRPRSRRTSKPRRRRQITSKPVAKRGKARNTNKKLRQGWERKGVGKKEPKRKRKNSRGKRKKARQRCNHGGTVLFSMYVVVRNVRETRLPLQGQGEVMRARRMRVTKKVKQQRERIGPNEPPERN